MDAGSHGQIARAHVSRQPVSSPASTESAGADGRSEAGTSTQACCESSGRNRSHGAHGHELQEPGGAAEGARTPSFLPVCLSSACPTQFMHLPPGARIAHAPCPPAAAEDPPQPHPHGAEADGDSTDEHLDCTIVVRIAEDVPERISRRGVLNIEL